MRTRIPVAMGPVTMNSPSVIRVTLPVTVRGRPARLICGMSIRPPRSRVTLAAVPASTTRFMVAGSQMGPAATSSGPWRITSSITLITSCVPPDAVLSPWSTSTMGPSPSVRACAIWPASGAPV